MSAHFADRLVAAVRQKGNAVCVGLDPRVELLPGFLWKRAQRHYGHNRTAVANAFVDFNCAIIDAVADVVPVCKPQIAFYEEYGAEGMRAFETTVRYAQAKGLLVISDAKRGDIGPTAEAYARAQLGAGDTIATGFDADALTVNPYMGSDTLEPYLEYCGERGKGVFVLVKTSNPGSGDVQDLETAGHPVYERVGLMVRDLGKRFMGEGGLSSVGAVVGATYPAQARALRELLPATIFLVPGYGAQGATAADAVAAFRADGSGAVVNSARGVTFAFRSAPYAARHDDRGFAAAARQAAETMASELNTALARR